MYVLPLLKIKVREMGKQTQASIAYQDQGGWRAPPGGHAKEADPVWLSLQDTPQSGLGKWILIYSDNMQSDTHLNPSQVLSVQASKHSNHSHSTQRKWTSCSGRWCLKPLLFKLVWTSETSGEPHKTGMSSFHPRIADSLGLGWNPPNLHLDQAAQQYWCCWSRTVLQEHCRNSLTPVPLSSCLCPLAHPSPARWLPFVNPPGMPLV